MPAPKRNGFRPRDISGFGDDDGVDSSGVPRDLQDPRLDPTDPRYDADYAASISGTPVYGPSVQEAFGQDTVPPVTPIRPRSSGAGPAPAPPKAPPVTSLTEHQALSLTAGLTAFLDKPILGLAMKWWIAAAGIYWFIIRGGKGRR